MKKADFNAEITESKSVKPDGELIDQINFPNLLNDTYNICYLLKDQNNIKLKIPS